jgi:Domain of unknown function (DUF4157)
MKKIYRKKRRRRARRNMSKSKSSSFFEPSLQRKCEECDKEGQVQKKSQAGRTATSSSFFTGYMSNIHAKGKPLPAGTRRFFESHLSGDFSNVRVHADAEATMAARAVKAKAFTWKNHIVFNQEHYDEHSVAGTRLMAHELTHAKQQQAMIQLQPEEDSGEVPQAASEEPQLEKQAVEEEQSFLPQSLPDFQTFGKPVVHTVFGKSIRIKGETNATFDGGTGSTRKLKATPSKACDNCADAECISVTGQLVLAYNVSTSVTLPGVPEGLSPCQEKRVKDAIDNKIKPHEEQHVNAFNTYKGTAVLPINFTGCKADLQTYVQDIHDKHAANREVASQAKSDALDPFHINIDLNCEEPPKK